MNQDRRDLLHRAADQTAGWDEEPLTSAEQAELAQLSPEVQQALLAEWASLSDLLRPLPALPRSQAAATASDIALAARLSQPVPELSMPDANVLAGQIAAEIALGAQLRPAQVKLPRSQAAEIAAGIRLSAQLQQLPSPPRASIDAAELAARIAREAQAALPHPPAVAKEAARPAGITELYPPHPDVRRGSRAAPLALVGSLIAGLLVLAVSSTWSGLRAGAAVLHDLLTSLPPTFGLGLVLLLATSLLIVRHPAPRWQGLGGAAFGLAALLTFPTLYDALDSNGISFGHDLVIEGQHSGPVIAVGSNIHLRSGSVVDGQVLTLLGDIQQDPGAAVQGQVTALLGQGPASATPQPASSLGALQLASATAIRPLLGWLGSTAWAALFWVLTSAVTLVLVSSGAGDQLARRQSRAPLQTLALGVLALAALLVPATLLSFAGWLAPGLALSLLLVLLLALGLGVSALDVGQQLAGRLKVNLPDIAGVATALALLAVSLVWPALTLAVVLIGGAWGSGTLLLVRQGRRETPGREPASSA
ncbi:polymer-forming cytoskeletal protein [Deinococcus sp. Marseille-Q6407]|uniref:polymer-forming cytoskeletal protein n=1 Tax=Deinococcus sp. Marseille-Q6407 TaxID=2969223 RepID=UPI0021BF09CE|nr:polymer-forming cytoskeletal protein [Deinococcus sp. Marseille-Q6407]